MVVQQNWKSSRRHYGPGMLWFAPLGTWANGYAPAGTANVFTQGTTATAVPGSTAALPLGWTDDGTKFKQSIKTDEDEAAESYYPVSTPVVGTSCTLEVSLKTVNLTNLRVALNIPASGPTGVPSPSTVSKLQPALAGAEVRGQLLFQSTENDLLIVMYQVLNTGDVELAFQKGAKGLSVPLTFNGELPDASVAPAPFSMYMIGSEYAESTSGE